MAEEVNRCFASYLLNPIHVFLEMYDFYNKWLNKNFILRKKMTLDKGIKKIYTLKKKGKCYKFSVPSLISLENIVLSTSILKKYKATQLLLECF